MAFDTDVYTLKYQDLKGEWVHVYIRADSAQYPNVSNKEVSGTAFLEYPEVEDVLEPLRSCGLRLDLQAQEGEDFEILWTEEERRFQVQMTIGPSQTGTLNTTYFWGFVKPDGIFQDWTQTEYDISIDCVGGLGFLEDLSYVDSSTGLTFSGLRRPIEIIADCLKRTGLNLPINVRTNLEYTGGSDKPLEGTRMKVDRYIRDDQDTVMSCKEVITDVLRVFGLCVCQDLGEWWIYDIETLQYNTIFTNSYDIYDKDGVSQPGSRDVFQFKEIGSHINTMGDLDPQTGGFLYYHINKNQRLESRPSLAGVRINYKYGLDESLIDNEFLQHNGSVYSGWTINDPTRHFFGDNGAGAKIGHDDSVVVMTSDAIAVAADDLITIMATVSNTILPSASRTFAFRARIGTSHYLNALTGEWKTSSYTNYREILFGFERVVGNTNIDPIPVSGSLIIEIMGFEFVTTTQGTVQVSKFSVGPGTEESALPIKGENHTVQLPGGSVAKDPIEVSNGDNPSSLYYGTIYKNDEITPTTEWTRPFQGENKPLLRLLAEKYVRVSQKPSRYFSGDVYNLLGYLNVVTIDNIEGQYIFLGYSLDTKNRIASIVVKQHYRTELSGEIYELTLDYGNTVKPTVVG